MNLNDKLTIYTKRRTADGYLAVSARIAKAGNVQIYRGDEVGRPQMATVRVYRPMDEVLSARPSFAHRPVTLGHPSEPVTADNWKAVAKGWTGDEVEVVGDIIRVPMLLADSDAIKAVEGGTRQLSVGYDCTLDWTPGVSPAGEAYDAVQKNIRGNHVAIVDAARGGPELTIGDGATHDGRPTAGMTVDQAAALPVYDAFRGHLGSTGMPLEREMAIRDLIDESADGQAAAAAQRKMALDLVGASQDVQGPETAYDNMVRQQCHAWRNG